MRPRLGLASAWIAARTMTDTRYSPATVPAKSVRTWKLVLAEPHADGLFVDSENSGCLSDGQALAFQGILWPSARYRFSARDDDFV